MSNLTVPTKDRLAVGAQIIRAYNDPNPVHRELGLMLRAGQPWWLLAGAWTLAWVLRMLDRVGGTPSK